MIISFPDRFVRRRVDRQLAGIADSVEKRLYYLIDNEYRGLSTNDRAAVVLEVVSALQEADLSDTAIFMADADSAVLARRIRATRTGVSSNLGEAGTQLYDVLLDECCDCLVRIIRQLPEFTPRAIGEILPRLSIIADQVSMVLDRLPVRTLDAPVGTQNDREFERRYREHLGETLDEVELFGVGVVKYRPRATLSVAYISLNVTAGNGNATASPAHGERLRFADLTGNREPFQTSMRAEIALTRWPRLLLRGQAGSGKSTLLCWAAVTAARGGLPIELADWNHRVPFLVKLRSYADRDLPQPEDVIAGPLRGLVPQGWAHRVLSADRGLLLVDGVDELPPAGRAGVRQWLRGLLVAYPGTRVIVTSRPAAADDRWLTAEGFSSVMLEPMTPSHLRELVKQWHAAAQHAESLPCTAAELPRYEGALLARFESAPHLRALAATPLLAAMICALNLDRSTHLPRDRMGLYSAALELLLERRDIEREITAHRGIALEREQKTRILQELAWQLTVFGRAEIATTTAVHRVAEKIATMPRITARPADVLGYLLQRSGIIREPVPGRIDFIHRTFQEYLAARQVADNADIEPLIARAHLDQWRETIIMAAGHANAPLRRELFTGLLNRADAEPRYRHRLRLLLTACLETAPDIPGDLRARVDTCIESLIPPKNAAEARPLSQASEEMVRRLPDTLAGLTTAEAVATIRTLWMINGPEALRKLARYASDPRAKVQDELIAAWDYFDPEEYARLVLADAPLRRGCVNTENIAALPAMSQLRNLRRLSVNLPRGAPLDCLAGVPSLDYVSARGIPPDSIPALASHQELRGVHLIQIHGKINDLSPLFGLRKLEYLYLYPGHGMPDISFLAHLPKLKQLGISGLDTVSDFSPITMHNSLRGLWLFGCRRFTDISILKALTRLEALTLHGARLGPDGLERIVDTFPRLNYLQIQECDWLTDLSPIAQLPLKLLIIGRAPRVTDLEPIRSLGQLEHLWFINMPITDLSAIAELRRLRHLEFKDCPDVPDLAPIAVLPRLRELVLYGSVDGIDLSPLRSMHNLSIKLCEGQRITGAEQLNKTARVEWQRDRWEP
jgi:hypothetical protein